MGTFGDWHTRFCMGEPDPLRLDPQCHHDGHGWWESECDWADADWPGLWFKHTCKTCGRHQFRNTKGESRFPKTP